jgi:DNA-binding transcriptional LysR family regulator
MSDLLEFRLLKYIVAIAETANFTRASERLFLAQPTLSQQVIALEEGIGVQIFVRRREGISLTPAGQMLYAYAQDALELRDEVVNAARAMDRGEIPVFRIGLSSFINPDVLQSLRQAYARLFPESPIQMTGGNPVQLLQKMEEKSLDAAILPLPVSGANWVVTHIASDPLVVCMRSDDPLAAVREIQPLELAGRLKVFRDPETHPAAHYRLMEMLTEIGIRPEASCLAATPADIQLMVQSGCGLALIDEKISLALNLTTRPIAGALWTADTAFVHDASADHIALPILLRHVRKMKRSATRKIPVQQCALKPVQLELLA